MMFLLIQLITFLTLTSKADEARPTSNKNSRPTLSQGVVYREPVCITSASQDTKEDFEKIIAALATPEKKETVGGKTKNLKLAGYIAIFGDSQKYSDIELITRLTYAETLATNCTLAEDKMLAMAKAIAGVIINRVHAFQDSGMDKPVLRTVFGRQQFASSLHSYVDANFKGFLCPSDTAFYKKIYELVSRMLSGEESYDKYTTHYYLHMHYKDKGYSPTPSSWKKGGKVIEPIRQHGPTGNCLSEYALDQGFLSAVMPN